MLSQCQLSFERLKQELFQRHQQEITLEMCREKWRDYLDVSRTSSFFSWTNVSPSKVIDENVRLTPAMVFAYHVVLLLNTSNGWMSYDQFVLEYQRRTNSNHLLYPTHYGFPTMARLFDAIRFIVQIQGQMLVIHPEFRCKWNNVDFHAFVSFRLVRVSAGEYSQPTPLAWSFVLSPRFLSVRERDVCW